VPVLVLIVDSGQGENDGRMEGWKDGNRGRTRKRALAVNDQQVEATVPTHHLDRQLCEMRAGNSFRTAPNRSRHRRPPRAMSLPLKRRKKAAPGNYPGLGSFSDNNYLLIDYVTSPNCAEPENHILLSTT
jgi:hypothetical protein